MYNAFTTNSQGTKFTLNDLRMHLDIHWSPRLILYWIPSFFCFGLFSVWFPILFTMLFNYPLILVPVGFNSCIVHQHFIPLVCKTLSPSHLFTLLKQVKFQRFNNHANTAFLYHHTRHLVEHLLAEPSLCRKPAQLRHIASLHSGTLSLAFAVFY